MITERMLKTTVRVNVWVAAMTGKKNWSPKEWKAIERLNGHLDYCAALLQRRKKKDGCRHYFRERKAA